MYIKGENLPDDPSLQVFGTKTSRILVGDLEHIKKYLKANQNQITDTYLQQDHRNRCYTYVRIYSYQCAYLNQAQ